MLKHELELLQGYNTNILYHEFLPALFTPIMYQIYTALQALLKKTLLQIQYLLHFITKLQNSLLSVCL